MRRFIGVVGVLALVAGLAAAGEGAKVPTPAPVAAEVGSSFTAVDPVRVLDTRFGIGTNGSRLPVGSRGTITLSLAAHVPAGATAVVFNVTGTAATAATHVTVFPAGTARPGVSNLNLGAGETRPVLVTVAFGADRGVQLYNHNGSVHLIADVAGYYTSGSGAKYTALSSTRVLDTRHADDIPALGPGATRAVDLNAYVPSSATAVVLNLTGTGSTATTYVTAWPTGGARPAASNLNLPPGSTRPNLATVRLGTGASVSLFNHLGQVDVLVDIVGFYTPEYGATFVPMSPVRVFDTRDGTGTTGAGAIGRQTRVPVHLDPRVPANATAALLTVTGVDPSNTTYVSMWARDGRADGSMSTLNLAPGETAANLAAVTLSTMEQVTAYNSSGNVHVIADLAGVFVTPTAGCVADCAYTWGSNESWALGTGRRTQTSATPEQVVGLSGVTALAGGRGPNRLALRSDGTVWAWGQAVFGQLGTGWKAIGWSAVPARVAGLTGVTAIDTGRYHAVALKSDGTVWSWGVNFEGGLGNGTNQGSDVPVRVSGLTGVTAVAAGDHTSYALRSDGTVWAWGGNTNGALGSASTAEYALTPVQVSGLSDVTAIAGGGYGGYALRTDGTAWAWGSNRAGELGNGVACEQGGDGCFSRTPVRVSGLTGVTAIAGSPFQGAGATGYAVTADGAAWAWGANQRGTLGTGVACTPATGEGCESRVPVRVSGLSGVIGMAGGAGVGYALGSDGTVWAWGENTAGGLGNGSACPPGPGDCVSTVPVQTVGISGATAVSEGGALVPNP